MSEFQEDVLASLKKREWMTVHDVAKGLYGPTSTVWDRGSRSEAETLASGSGIEMALDALVAAGRAEMKRVLPWVSPLGKMWRRTQ